MFRFDQLMLTHDTDTLTPGFAFSPTSLPSILQGRERKLLPLHTDDKDVAKMYELIAQLSEKGSEQDVSMLQVGRRGCVKLPTYTSNHRVMR